MACKLDGKGVLVTRAIHQASALAGLVESQGGRAICFPALRIVAGPEPSVAREQLLQAWDLVIFISPNAVRFGIDLLAGVQLQSRHIAAVGGATAKALHQAGMHVDLIPPVGRYDSEGLLALTELQKMQQQRVLIVRGRGGRPLLGDTLQARGAKVGYAEVYQRLRPDTDPTSLLQRWPVDVDIVTATSTELLVNLVAMLGDEGWPLLRQTPVLVISDRMVERAKALGFTQVVRASGADDASLLSALCQWVEGGQH
jgi:uroporphyrinogen-III synthase